MAKDKLHAHIILDRSGSMAERASAVRNAVNEYVSSLAKDGDIDARISLTMFDAPHRGPAIDLVANNVKAKDFVELTDKSYVPRGMTPLNDAIGIVVGQMASAKLRSGERVAIVIMTDGMENTSKEFTASQIKVMLDLHKERDNWLVIYLGANQDSFAEGAKRGIDAGMALNFKEGSYHDTMAVAYASTRRFGLSGDTKSAMFSDEERSRAVAK